MRGSSWLLAVVLLLLPACTTPPERSTITVLASWTGQEAEQFQVVLDAFTERTGIRVDYQGTRALEQVLLADVQKGAPPDVAIVPSPAELQRYVDADVLRPLGSAARPTFWDQVQGLGTGVRRAVVVKADLKSIVWYRSDLEQPQFRTWQEMHSRRADWCLGMGAPPLTGWPGTDWIEDLMLQRYGKADYEQWATGEMPWTDDRVRSSWQAWGELVAASTAADGPAAALLTDFGDAGSGMFEQPQQRCSLDHAGSFVKSIYQAPQPGAPPREAGRHFDFFPFPPFAEQPERQPSIVSGDLAVLFGDSAPAREFLDFLDGDGQRLWVGQPGSGVYSIDVGPEGYAARPGGEIDSRIAEEIRREDGRLCFDASDLMPAVMRNAFHRGVLEYIAAPERLREILEQLEAVHRTTGEPWARFACG
ncbi:ABC transporter substrate-binding protein [Saccharopolyspora antimicrobica]|nr:extracellular solute-binding protein [Saccharopolyspora antimicrobica]